MINVYKKSGTNPFGGCLPLVLQMPIFFALFTTLRNAYELRGTPFIGWIRDLSAPDTLFYFPKEVPLVGGAHFGLLPLLMGAGMFLQSRMSGATSDPTQRQMMYIMPVMMTFMFWSFPSGLVLYWFTSNMINMTFQYSFAKMQRDPSPRVIDTTVV
jgi:YidC/Oxa1 family membrane protein insertase